MDIYEYLINNKENKFKKEFETEWIQFLNDLKLPYTENKVLHLGNRFRPRLVCFGYLFSNNISLSNFSKIASVGVCVEALHKASLIIDDIIDNDNKRYGHCAFHKQFSVNETIAFSVHLIGKSCSLLNRTFHENVNDSRIVMYAMDLYSNIISEMTYGALLEMGNNENSIENVRKITNFETATLIKNSLLLGYLMGHDCNEAVIKIFIEIGNKCGELYQLLNDLEPFLNPQFNARHKGKVNVDFNNYRKNIVVAFIRETLGTETIRKLMTEDTDNVEQSIVDLMQNNKIKIFIQNEIISHYNAIINLMNCLETFSENKEWHKKFRDFFDATIKWGTIRSRLYS